MEDMLPKVKLAADTSPTRKTTVSTSLRTATTSLCLLLMTDRWKTRRAIIKHQLAGKSSGLLAHAIDLR